MYLVGLGVLFMALKYLEIDPVVAWNWWIVMSPFGLAVAWWTWADATGYTKRKAMEAEDARKKDRIERNREAMGFLSAKNKKKR
ncbi:MAG: TIGR04438 family Trp-rich protein [Pseudomonadota bacterium]